MHFRFPVIVCFLFESHCWSCVVIASYLSVHGLEESVCKCVCVRVYVKGYFGASGC